MSAAAGLSLHSTQAISCGVWWRTSGNRLSTSIFETCPRIIMIISSTTRLPCVSLSWRNFAKGFDEEILWSYTTTVANIDLKNPGSFDKGAIPYFFLTSKEAGSSTSASGFFGKTVGVVINEFANSGDKVVATHETLHI